MMDQDVLLERRRRLGGELRRLREQAGLSGRDLAGLLGISQSKISRIESGTALPTVPEVKSWTSATTASELDSEMLQMLTDAAYMEIRPWDDALRGGTHFQDSIRDLESSRGIELTYEPSIVPGLLQTAEYARRLFTMFRPQLADQEIPAAVKGRLGRQDGLFDPSRRFEFLITEAALRFRLGPASVTAAQVDRIASLSTLENVGIGLIPAGSLARTYVPHGFVIFESTDGEPNALVLTETVHANLTMSGADHVELYRQHWSLLRESAVFGADARDLLDTVSEDAGKLSTKDQ
jgi:transcriptional regulator with XRE-family HTH domain